MYIHVCLMNVRRNIVIDKKLEDTFRRRISDTRGDLKKGAISEAHAEAMKLWINANPKKKSAKTKKKKSAKTKKKTRR